MVVIMHLCSNSIPSRSNAKEAARRTACPLCHDPSRRFLSLTMAWCSVAGKNTSGPVRQSLQADFALNSHRIRISLALDFVRRKTL